ncbi:MAG: hypothetical protein ACXWDM_09795 [Nocardioides sp.]
MHHLLRPVAVLATAAVIATSFTQPAQAAPDDLGARWLERQLTDGLVHNDQFDFDDYGLTADVALGLDAIGGQRATVRGIGNALAPHVNSWTTGVDFGSDDIYAGSVAKAVVLAQAAGKDPRAFGGVDLVERLEGLVSDESPTVGRIEDQGADDFSNTIGQSFALTGLAAAGSRRTAGVRRFLLLQQCDAGWFRLNFSRQAKLEQGCEFGSKATRKRDTDVTALAVLALDSLPKQGRRVRAAVDNATDWLVRTQRRNGSFGGGPATQGSNANSTGLAAWALGEVGACSAARVAGAWVQGLQLRGDLSGTEYAGEKGAIAYNGAAHRAGETDGITTETRDQWRRTSAQAVPGLNVLTDCR